MTRARGWMQQEPGGRGVMLEVVRLAQRGVRRPVLALLCALGLSLLVVSGMLLKEYRYKPQYVVRVVEMDRNPLTAPRPKRKLREHVRDAVFSNTRLSQLVERFNLYPALYRSNPVAALTSFREDIEIDVFRNYFVEERSPHDPPRSARISLSYRSADRRTGLAVTRALGRLVVDYELENRKRQAAAAADEAQSALDRARTELLELRRQIARRAVKLGVDLENPEMRAALLYVEPEMPADAPAAALPAGPIVPPLRPDFSAQLTGDSADDQSQTLVELVGLKSTLTLAERRLVDAERRKADLELGRDLEQGALGLRFEVIDEGAIASSAGIGSDDLTIAGFTTFLLGLPLIVLFVGAFDSRVHNLADVARLGLRPLGVVRAPFASRGRS